MADDGIRPKVEPFRSPWTYRIQGCGAMLRARWQSPLGPFCRPNWNNRSTRSKSALKGPIQGG